MTEFFYVIDASGKKPIYIKQNVFGGILGYFRASKATRFYDRADAQGMIERLERLHPLRKFKIIAEQSETEQ